MQMHLSIKCEPMKKAPSSETIDAWARLIRVSQSLLDQIEADLKVKKLPPLAWYDVLHELASEGKRGLRPFELEERMLLPQYKTSRLLARMEKDGVVERGLCPEDGRGQVVRITTKGKTMRRRIWDIYGRAIQKQIGDPLSTTQIQELNTILLQLKSALD